MSKGSRIGIDGDTPRLAGLDDYSLVQMSPASFPNEIGRASGSPATQAYGQTGQGGAGALQDDFGDSLDFDLLRQYAELYAELTGTMLVPAGSVRASENPFVAAGSDWDESGTSSWTDKTEPAAQPGPVFADHGSAPALLDTQDLEEPNPVLSALGFFDAEPF